MLSTADPHGLRGHQKVTKRIACRWLERSSIMATLTPIAMIHAPLVTLFTRYVLKEP
jgi:hypothetical protein